VLTLLVTSPRVAPGLLTLQAWDALRGAGRVLAHPGHPQLAALTAAGIDVDTLEQAAATTDAALARQLTDATVATDGPVVWLADPPVHPGGDGGPAALKAALDALDAGNPVPGTEVLRGSVDLPGSRLLDLVATMTILRQQCPWDAKQTHESLAPHLLEEPYEALEALENGDDHALREELGDVLLQVLFHAEVASERDDGTGYTIDDVADGIVAKLVRRHPHVFAGVAVSGADEVKLNWDEIKKAERASKAGPDAGPVSALDGVPLAQPGLSLATQFQRRAARAGLPDELLAEDGDGTAEQAADGLGGQLFALVATARAADLDPELELRAAARRYRDRVRAWEQAHPSHDRVR
jgi:NTP pyrophosphatase (non-canonical NTP hydrolase)